jgi:carboxyl-terminal processing protease
MDEPRREIRISWNVLQITIFFAALMVTAFGAFVAGYLTANGGMDDRFKLIKEAWAVAERDFYGEKPSESDRVTGAIYGMLSAFEDPYMGYDPLEAVNADPANMQGGAGGIGATVQLNDDNQIVIVEAKLGWPAEQAGVRAGDIVLTVDGKDMSVVEDLNAALQLIRGPIGTTVRLTLKRANVVDPIEVTVTRDQINVIGAMLDGNIGYLSLTIFNRTSAEDVEKNLNKLLELKPRAIIFDLRGNPGGYLSTAVAVADLFLPEGIVVTEKTTSGDKPPFFSDSGDPGEDIPLIVLVDQGSASASEVVAGALKDRGRAILIGQQTYGKGSVQAVSVLSDGSQLRITNGAWYTPDQTPIQDVGLTPDIVIEPPSDPNTITPGSDPIRDAAVKYIEEHFKSN